MTVQVSPAELQAAIDDSGELLRRLIETHPDAERAAFVLIGALQILHAFADERGRAALEERIRAFLTQLYQTPPADQLLARGAEFRIHQGPPR